MSLTLDTFRHCYEMPEATATLDQQHLKLDNSFLGRRIKPLAQHIVGINMLPSLRRQRAKNRQVKNALLIAISQEYGIKAAQQISQLPIYWDRKRPLNGRKVKKILYLLGHFYQSLHQTEMLPRFVLDDLSVVTQQTVHRMTCRHSIAALMNKILSASISAKSQHTVQYHVRQFLQASPERQLAYRENLKQRIQQGQVQDHCFDDLLELSKDQRLALYAFMCTYQRLPESQPNMHLPFSQPSVEPLVYGREEDITTLPLEEQLRLLDYAAASRSGYRRPIDPVIINLLTVKGRTLPKTYYDRTLENLLLQYDSHLHFSGDHLYSDLGLSAHLITREQDGQRELSLVFGGLGSYAPIQQFKAVLTNIISNVFGTTAALYSQAADVALQVALYARANGFDQVTVSGHSLGGSLAEYAIEQHPAFIDKAVVFQPFHVLGQHRAGLIADPQICQKIVQVVVCNDWITPHLPRFTLEGTRTITLSARRYDQPVHIGYRYHLFEQVLHNISVLASTA